MFLMAALRSIPAALMVGLGIWCAAGHLAVFDDRSVGQRLAVPSPLWVFFVAFAASFLVPPWRRRPWLATPALLATLPWWPVPLPAIALIWTGPLAWVAIAAAGVAAVIAIVSGRPQAHVTKLPRAHWHAIAAAALTVVAGVAVAWSVAPRTPSGDEPHYLVIAQSLFLDGDLRIQNNHDRRDYAAYFDRTLAPDSRVRGRDGQQYSIHAPGVATLVLPLFTVFGYRGAQATMLVTAAIAAGMVWWIGWLAAGRVSAAWFGWAAVAGSVTFLLQSVLIFPDGPAALAVAAACWLLLRLSMRATQTRTIDIVATAALLAALPWLHTRFALLAGAFGVAVVVVLLREPVPLGARLRRVAAFAVIPIVSAALWLSFFWRIYGTPDPRAPYGLMQDASWWFIPGGVAGLLFDQQFGLLVYTPVLLALLGLLALPRQGSSRAPVLWPLAIAAIYLAGTATVWMWWAGRPATPARFANAVLPVMAAPLALVFARATPAMRTVWSALLAVSLGTAACVVAIGRGALAWNDRTGQSQWLEWLSPVVNLPRGYPSFFWTLNPQALTSEIPFLIHAAVWTGGIALTVWLIVRLSSAPQRAPAGRAVAAFWCGAVAWMTLVSAGWMLNGVNGLDPARSQLAVLQRLASGRPMYTVGALSVTRADGSELERVVIRTEEPGKVDTSPPSLVLNGVPAGVYSLSVLVEMSKPGRLQVYVGNHLYRTIQMLHVGVNPTLRERVHLPLPAGAATLIVRADGELRGEYASVEMRPEMVRSSAPELARSAMRFGGSDVFFLDDDVYPEGSGFWTKGERTASFLFATDAGRPAIALTLRNGPHQNVVTVQAGALARPETLQPDETRTLTIPVDLDGLVTISVTTSRGFRPADVSGSPDRRNLGVWVEIK